MRQRWKTIFFSILIVVFCLLIMGGCVSSSIDDEVQVSEPQDEQIEETGTVTPDEAIVQEEPAYEGLELTMLDVGQGLSLLIKADGQYMMYDGGGRSRSSYVVAYLKQHGIQSLKYVIASHYDEDHISGLIGVMNTCAVDEIITPAYEADTDIYYSFQNKITEKNLSERHPSVGDVFQLGNAEITVIGPSSYSSYDDNNSSIAFILKYGTFKCLITGDAELDEERMLVSSGKLGNTDLYIVGHHGSASSSSNELLNAAKPECAFISVGKDNSYGHPTQEVLQRLQDRGIKIYRTDVQGEITLTSDGANYWVNKDPITATIEEQSAAQALDVRNTTENHRYVLNTNPDRKRIHSPDCYSVKSIKPENFAYSDKSLEELIEEGYTPCGNCHPE